MKYRKEKLDCIDIRTSRVEYYITTDGHVYSRNIKTGTEHELTQQDNSKGYYYVYIAQGSHSHRTRYYIHRLVAMQFIPNPKHKPTVNHIDGNKQNNCVTNLEWATREEQMYHAVHTLKNLHQQRTCYCQRLGESQVYTFDTISDCAQFTKADESKIRYALKHTQYTAGWLYSLDGNFPNITEPPKGMRRTVYVKDTVTGHVTSYTNASTTAEALGTRVASVQDAIHSGYRLQKVYYCSYNPFD